MPRDIKLLTIFVSCPQDLAPERSVLESVIDELNQKLRDSHSVEFRTMGWGSLVPGVGPDAQAVINNQVGEDYDIYIGILGHRFGTQTQGLDPAQKRNLSEHTSGGAMSQIL